MKNKPNESSSTKSKAANTEFLARRVRRLADNRTALSSLHEMGLTDETIKKFHLGLSEPYTDSRKVVHADALIAPVISTEGKPTGSSVYFNIPKVTGNPGSENFWARGAPRTYRSGAVKGMTSVFVCSEPREVWYLGQLAAEAAQKSKILFISSTHPEYLPEEWYQRDFWDEFENVYLGHPNDAAGDRFAARIAPNVGQPALRVRLPKNKGGWADFCRYAAHSLQEFDRLLSEAKFVGSKIESAANGIAPGRSAYQPIDIAGTFHNGYLYYPVKTVLDALGRYRDEQGNPVSQMTSRKEVVLIRSDHTHQTVWELPAPPGTPLDERVLKLDDGTLIESRPKASMHSTWSWDSIERFLDGETDTRQLNAILEDVKSFLKQVVWLPLESDYDLLTLLVPITYAQAIFQAVPLVLVTGAPGSGKSALGKAMVKVCANASIVGQISAPAVARLIDETKGFVVFDDLESVGRRKGGEAAHFSDLVQSLKLSYNRETSWKTWTDTSRGMSVKRLNFFGVKMINNTRGTDDILGSRVLRIYTRKIPGHLQGVLGVTDAWDVIALNKLRDELHTWTFENVDLIAQTYQRLFAGLTDRATEIFAPLRVFAELSQSEELQAGLIRALEFQTALSGQPINPAEIMKEAVARLIVDGCTALSPTEVLFEIEQMTAAKPYPNLDESANWRNPAWIGRHLRSHGIIDKNASPSRKMVAGKYIRAYPLRDEYVRIISADRR